MAGSGHAQQPRRRVQRAAGDRQQALAYFNQALPIVREVGDRGGEAATLNNLGAVYNASGDRQQALAYYNQALPIVREVGDRGGKRPRSTTSVSCTTRGDRQQALAYFNQALPIVREVGDRGGEATTLNNLGLVYDALGSSTGPHLLQPGAAHPPRGLGIGRVRR